MINYLDSELCNLTKSSTDFDCLPMGIKIEEFVKFIIKSGNNEFLVDDLIHLFIKANLKSPRTGKVINPNAYKLTQQIDRLILNNIINIVKEDEVYKVKDIDFKLDNVRVTTVID